MSNSLNDGKTAFAAILCDVNMIEPMIVSLFTLDTALKQNSLSDIVLFMDKDLVMNQKQLEQVQNFSTHIIRTTFEFCSNSISIQLWTLLDYQKVIYFTPNILFENDVEQLFNFPSGSRINTNEKTDTSLFILEPNLNTFEELKKTLNSKQFTVSQLLDEEYPKYQYHIPRKVFQRNIQVFDGLMKPWNFHKYHEPDWRKELYDLYSFYRWRLVIQAIQPSDHTWKNEMRSQTVCNAYIHRVQKINSFPIRHKFSVLISTYSPDRIEHLSLLLRHVLKSTKVHTAYVTWHNPHLKVPLSLYQHVDKKDYPRIRVLTQTFDSLNNRFNPIEDLQTDAVYIMDDDIYIDLNDLEFTYEIWKNRKDSVVGHFPRRHTYDKDTHEATYDLIGNTPYTIILTKSMFIRSDYLFSYTCLLEPKLHSYVDKQLNCEDIGFMMMVSGMSGASSTFVYPENPIEDFGLKHGISINNSHMSARSRCISEFITLFWEQKDPLISSYDTITQFNKPVIETGDWNRVKGYILERK